MHLFIIGRLSSIVADIIIILLTWTKTIRERMDGVRINNRASMLAVVFDNGTISFGAVCALNVAVLVGGRTWGLSSAFIDVAMAWIGTVTSILTCRFMLDLRETGAWAGGTTITQPTHLNTIAFRPQAVDTMDLSYPIRS
ncbi:hypothetical protein B0H21DRAFT_38323 [Amylocystis lapponica]|nr:hypothetical protein B0H21DRAFT_38323 [Amylocystis lapponica]